MVQTIKLRVGFGEGGSNESNPYTQFYMEIKSKTQEHKDQHKGNSSFQTNGIYWWQNIARTNYWKSLFFIYSLTSLNRYLHNIWREMVAS